MLAHVQSVLKFSNRGNILDLFNVQSVADCRQKVNNIVRTMQTFDIARQ